MWACRLCSCVALLLLAAQVQAFRNGDYIQAARKAQFHAQRTHWHDLIGESCPRFGRDRLVVITLPKPVSPPGVPLDEYKLQLSFDGDRHLTSWLKLYGKGAPNVPMLKVKLRRSGEDLLGASAQVTDAPKHIQHADQSYVSEWHNATHWPKRLLVSYRWDTHTDVDLDRGFILLLTIGVFVMLLLGMNAAMAVGPKLAQFLAEVAADLDTDVSTPIPASGVPTAVAMPVANVWKGGGKGE